VPEPDRLLFAWTKITFPRYIDFPNGTELEYPDRCGVLTSVPANDRSLREKDMSFTGRFLITAMLSLAFTASAYAQAPQTEKSVSADLILLAAMLSMTRAQCA
jgi:hypothetical protein